MIGSPPRPKPKKKKKTRWPAGVARPPPMGCRLPICFIIIFLILVFIYLLNINYFFIKMTSDTFVALKFL
jgi:hypothetical protein